MTLVYGVYIYNINDIIGFPHYVIKIGTHVCFSWLTPCRLEASPFPSTLPPCAVRCDPARTAVGHGVLHAASAAVAGRVGRWVWRMGHPKIAESPYNKWLNSMVYGFMVEISIVNGGYKPSCSLSSTLPRIFVTTFGVYYPISRHIQVSNYINDLISSESSGDTPSYNYSRGYTGE